jgi:hypothetical protein
VLRHAPVEHTPSVVCEHEEDVEHGEPDGRHDEEVGADKFGGVVLQAPRGAGRKASGGAVERCVGRQPAGGAARGSRAASLHVNEPMRSRQLATR